MMLEISQDWQRSPPASTQAVCVFQLGVGTSMEEMFANVALMCAHITRDRGGHGLLKASRGIV